MVKPRYQIVISLSEEDTEKLASLRKEGYQIVEIFRLGMGEAEAEAAKARRKKENESARKERPEDTLF
ncbi:MAG TPA: hypothetical protein PL037_07260 [Elusimicrobiales bacterium]|nr:hypothetical protein [Elusimicrobiales bacterium]